MSTALLERPTVELDDHIRELVAKAPPISDDTLARIMALFTAGR